MSHEARIPPPIVVGATGGSGTRVVQAILAAAGCYMGGSAGTNRAGDAAAFFSYYRSRTPRYIRRWRADGPHPIPDGLADELRACAAQHRRGYEDGPWGWKNPRSMFALPVIEEAFPGVRFVHVVRDGRDIAFSSNQFQVGDLAISVLGWRAFTPTFDKAVVSARLWTRSNMIVGEYGHRHLGERYHLLRYEDLCREPDEEVTRLLDFAGLTADVAACADLVRMPGSIGRWREQPSRRADRVVNNAREGLEYFGYA